MTVENCVAKLEMSLKMRVSDVDLLPREKYQ